MAAMQGLLAFEVALQDFGTGSLWYTLPSTFSFMRSNC